MDLSDLLKITNDVYSIMEKIPIDTSPGPDKILMKAIKNPIAASIIATILNRMIMTGFVPDVFKEAKTILIHNGGTDFNLNSWRQITISSVCVELYRKL